MYSFILGFQRLVWCPKWTPASSSSFMVIVANEPPRSVCILRAAEPLRIAIPVPAPRGSGRIEHLKTNHSYGLSWLRLYSPHAGLPPPAETLPATSLHFPLRELEPLAGALLSVLLAFFAARVPADHALALQFLAQLSIELHQGPGDSELHGVCLAANSAAQHIRDHIERSRRVRRSQRSLRRRTLRRSHEIFLECAPVHLELTAARTQIHGGVSPLASSRSVILN